MEGPIGISIYFRNDRIHIWKSTIRVLENPRYVHLRMNEGKKYLFISACEKDKDAFRIYYSLANSEDNSRPKRFHINAKGLLTYLSRIIGVERDSDSLKFFGELLLPEKAVCIDLKNYEIIPYLEEGE